MIQGYFTTSEIEGIYRKLKRTGKGITAFKKDTRAVASKVSVGPESRIVYKDEEALFEVFKKHLPNELKALGIDCFGRLMQYVS